MKGSAAGATSTIPRDPTPRQRLAARALSVAFRVINATQRIQVVDPHDAMGLIAAGPVIFAFWHNRLAFTPMVHRRVADSCGRRGRRVAALVSASRDGAFLAAVLEAFGI